MRITASRIMISARNQIAMPRQILGARAVMTLIYRLVFFAAVLVLPPERLR
jgi:hypothetical protein